MNSKVFMFAALTGLSALSAYVSDGASSESARIAFSSKVWESDDTMLKSFLSRNHTESQSNLLSEFSSFKPGFLLFLR